MDFRLAGRLCGLTLFCFTACSDDPAAPAPDGSPADGAVADTSVHDSLKPDRARRDLPRADRWRKDGAVPDKKPTPDKKKPTPDKGPAPDIGPVCPAGKWCSVLYPPTWTPAMKADSQGRFLHDFSYAGYHRGEKALPATAPGKVFDVVKGYGADSTGKKDCTAAAQKAIVAAAAAGGGVVHFPAGTYRLDGRLTVSASKVVLRGAGPAKTKLHFTSHKSMSSKGHIAFAGKVKRGADIFLAVDGQIRSKVVRVTSAAGIKVGDEVSVGWVITTDFVKEHNMTGYWKPFYNQWKAMFRRTVVAVDAKASPPKITLDIPLRYAAKKRDKASLRLESGYLSECGIEHLGISNAVAWKDAWANNQTHAMTLSQVKDCWLRNVASVPSPGATGWNAADKTKYHLQSSGVRVLDSKRMTISKCNFSTPQHRGGGGNGYLVHITRSNEILVADTVATKGRHNLIQNWDFGTTGCVFLRCTSSGSTAVTMVLNIPIPVPAASEYHHSLAMANLVDKCQLDDGWQAINRLAWSSGAGLTSTGCAFWNATGVGTIMSMQFGWGYVIGTGSKIKVNTSLLNPSAAGSKPQDFVEGKGKGATLWPPSLYEHQKSRRIKP